MKSVSNNLHDKLFKETFSSVREARAFLVHFVDANVLKNLDLDTLTLENGSYTDEDLQEYFADIVYSCQSNDGGTMQFSFLLEHKSYYDKGLSIQLLRYLTKGYRRRYTENPQQPIGLIFPILLYHGTQKWQKRELSDMAALPDAGLIPYLPTFKYPVIDLGTVANEMLRSIKSAVLMPKTLLLFKHKDDKGFILKNSAELLTFVESELNYEQKKRILLTLLRYVFAVHQINQTEYRTFTKKLDDMTQAVAGSLYDTIQKESMEKGVQKGIKKGLQKGIQKTRIIKDIKVLCALLQNFPDLPDEKIARLASAPLEDVKSLRNLLKKHTVKTAYKQVLKTYFKDIDLTEEEKADVVESVKNFYKEK